MKLHYPSLPDIKPSQSQTDNWISSQTDIQNRQLDSTNERSFNKRKKMAIKLKCGYEVLPLTEDETKEENKGFARKPLAFIKLQPGGFIFADSFAGFADRYFDFKFRSDDVLLIGYPKSGTTWAQEILWTLIHNSNLDNPAALQHINRRVPFFEHDYVLNRPNVPPLEPGNLFYDTFVKDFPDKDPRNGIILQTLEAMQQRRVMKTHLLFSNLNPNVLETCKVVYIARDPYDVIFSFFHYNRLLKSCSYTGNLEDFIQKIIAEGVKGSRQSLYWAHMKEAWERRNHPNLHLIYYEDLKANPKAEYVRLQHFLGLSLSETQIDKVVQHTSFSSMKDRDSKITEKFNSSDNNPEIEMEGGFFRKGVSGDSKSRYTKEQEIKLQEWIKENAEELGPDFRYWK